MSGFTLDNRWKSVLGGGMPGAQPPGGLLGGGAGTTGGTGMVGSSERGRSRFILRNAFAAHRLPMGTATNPGFIRGVNGVGLWTGGFRRNMIAGDLNGTVNASPLLSLGASNQVNNVRRQSIHNGADRLGGHVANGAAAFSGNPTWVYDSSDYIRYKKLYAKRQTYNDSSFGGANNGAYVAWMRVHHS